MIARFEIGQSNALPLLLERCALIDRDGLVDIIGTRDHQLHAVDGCDLSNDEALAESIAHVPGAKASGGTGTDHLRLPAIAAGGGATDEDFVADLEVRELGGLAIFAELGFVAQTYLGGLTVASLQNHGIGVNHCNGPGHSGPVASLRLTRSRSHGLIRGSGIGRCRLRPTEGRS